MPIQRLLDQHGLELLGVADTAFVFARPDAPDEVVKVGLDPDDGWPAWAAWCRANPGPHVPRIHALHDLPGRDGRAVVFVARVERLRPSLVGRNWIKAAPRLKRDPIGLATHVKRTHPHIAVLLHAAARAFPRGHWDMGGPNWMERGDGTVVLNDPLSRADVGLALAA